MTLYLRICALLLLLCSFILGCSPAAEEITYTVYEENGAWYIKTNAGLPESVLNAGGRKEILKDIPYLDNRYSSVSELREKVLHDGLEQKDLQWLQFTAYPDKPIPICDMESLYEPVFSEELKVDYVSFIGDCLEFPFYQVKTGLSKGSVYIYYDSKEYQFVLQNYKGGKDAPRLSFDGEIPDRAARAVLTDQGVAVGRGELYYELDTGNGILYVCEPPPDGQIVEMFGEKDDVFYRIVIYCNGLVPRLKWLSQFSIKPFENTN